MTFVLDIWHAGSIETIQFEGQGHSQSLRSHKETRA